MKRHERARNGTVKGLSAKQERVALLLASGQSQEKAARESQTGLRTIKTWLAECPTFKQRIDDLSAEMTQRALSKLVSSMVGAAATLRHLCRHGRSEQIRLG